MAAPNIVNVATITAKTVGYAVTTSLASTGVSNAASSGKVFKINSITCANVDGTNAADISVSIYKNQTTDFYLAKTITVPADASLVVLGKDSNPIYLEENDSIRAIASATGDLELVISYEEIS